MVSCSNVEWLARDILGDLFKSGDMLDVGVYGFCLPPKTMVFPHLTGYVQGFGPAPETFGSWRQHHVKGTEARKEYDFMIFSVVRHFSLQEKTIRIWLTRFSPQPAVFCIPLLWRNSFATTADLFSALDVILSSVDAHISN